MRYRANRVKGLMVCGARTWRGVAVMGGVLFRKSRCVDDEDTKARACARHVEGPIWHIVL